LFLGAAVLDERITPLTIGAACLVLSGVALVLFQGWRPTIQWRRTTQKSAVAEHVVETTK
jgi:drug/metabolite transporter (DMT)-like permease